MSELIERIHLRCPPAVAANHVLRFLRVHRKSSGRAAMELQSPLPKAERVTTRNHLLVTLDEPITTVDAIPTVRPPHDGYSTDCGTSSRRTIADRRGLSVHTDEQGWGYDRSGCGQDRDRRVELSDHRTGK